MNAEYLFLSLDEVAAAVALEVAVVRRYAEIGLIRPAPPGYGPAELAELRRVRRLMEDMELDHGAIEIVLRMRRQILALRAEVRRMEAELRAAQRRRPSYNWADAEWDDR
jgi:hypothetical protein